MTEPFSRCLIRSSELVTSLHTTALALVLVTSAYTQCKCGAGHLSVFPQSKFLPLPRKVSLLRV